MLVKKYLLLPRITREMLRNYKFPNNTITRKNTSRFKVPDFADILITNHSKKEKKPSIRIGRGAFSALEGKNEEEFSVFNYLIYPKDVPKELHLSAIRYNENKGLFYVIPAEKQVINNALKNNDAQLFIVANAVQLFSQQSKFVQFIIELREKIGYQKIIYLPCVGDPTSFALLTYMGVDLFDSMAPIIDARNEVLLFPEGNYKKNELKELPCSCPSCNNTSPDEMSYSDILDHNYFAVLNEIKHVRNAIESGSLRELVETRVRVNPTLTAMLRILDFDYLKYLEERTPIVRKNKLLATTKESLFRPEIKRFQERVLKRYEKPNSAKILLLLPCSAKKPYSFSKSHKLFREQLFNTENPYVVHEVIVTSPLGLVPRELELTYPASKYDIAVTGKWDEDEKKMIRELLQQYLVINTYEKIIVHLPQAILDFVADLLKSSKITCIESPTSRESLDKLSDILKKTTDQYDFVESSRRMQENINSIATFQFGKEIAHRLLKDTRIKGKYPYQKIMHNNNQLGMITEERGLISLTIAGAERIADFGKYWVEIYTDFTLKGSVFAPGVKDADESIRIGDEIIVLRNNKVCGVGIALMNGKEMKESDHGEAIKTRHRV